MTAKEAALEILRRAGGPLYVEELTKRILAEGLWETRGETPSRTVGARLYKDIQKNKDKSPFVLLSPSTFALRDSAEISSSATPVPAAAQEAPQPFPANAGFSFTNCAQKVLEEFGGKKPMHYKEIGGKWLCEMTSAFIINELRGARALRLFCARSAFPPPAESSTGPIMPLSSNKISVTRYDLQLRTLLVILPEQIIARLKFSTVIIILTIHVGLSILSWDLNHNAVFHNQS